MFNAIDPDDVIGVVKEFLFVCIFHRVLTFIASEMAGNRGSVKRRGSVENIRLQAVQECRFML